MKKHQLLEKAMRDYPAGTVARFESAPNVGHTSDGIFRFCDFNQDGKLYIVSGEGSNCFYSDGEWAIPVKPSILNGKVAIQVNNEREFKLLMEHYEQKGWMSEDGVKPTECMCFYGFPVEIEYSDSMTHGKFTGGYKIIPFSDFAKEVGIDVPVFVMKSEDGVDLYISDPYYRVAQIDGNWELSSGVSYLTTNDKDRKYPFKNVLFSTKKAAEKWIEEQNMPTYVLAHLTSKGNTAKVFRGGEVDIELAKGIVTRINIADVKAILEAYQSLQEAKS